MKALLFIFGLSFNILLCFTPIMAKSLPTADKKKSIAVVQAKPVEEEAFVSGYALLLKNKAANLKAR